MCIGCTPNQPTDFYVSRDPYVWSLDGSAAQKQSHAVEFIKKQLVGKKAVHGGDGVGVAAPSPIPSTPSDAILTTG
jgi:hypothetical protein